MNWVMMCLWASIAVAVFHNKGNEGSGIAFTMVGTIYAAIAVVAALTAVALSGSGTRRMRRGMLAANAVQILLLLFFVLVANYLHNVEVMLWPVLFFGVPPAINVFMLRSMPKGRGAGHA